MASRAPQIVRAARAVAFAASIGAVGLGTVVIGAGGQAPAARTQQKLPPLSYVCPMAQDADVLEDKPGKCPKCGMKLEPIRLDLKYTCPTNPEEVHDGPGKCTADKRRDLIPVTLSLVWSCEGQPDKFLEPGKCGTGQPRFARYEQRPHGDHNPKHGGQFFMAPDAWHHLEGTLPTAGLFRMYFYNDYSKPLVPKGFSATVSVLDKSDQEVDTYELKPGRITNALEARIPGASLPISLLARVKFTLTAERGSVFNFAFAEATVEPKGPPVTTRSMPSSSPAAAASAAAGAAPAPPTPAAGAELPSNTPQITTADTPQPLNALAAAALDEAALPKATPELLGELSKRSAEIEQLLQEGNLGQIWLPAMATKTVALALESHSSALPERQRMLASRAIKRVVTAAWELDAYGDLGNKQKIADAYRKLASAVAELKSAYAAQ